MISLKAIHPKRLQLVDATLTSARMRAGMKKYLELVAEEMQKYPPQRPKIKYSDKPWLRRRRRRTNKLKNGWKNPNAIKVSQDGSSGTLTNSVEYAVHVQGPRGGGREAYERQTQRSRDAGWQSITDVARRTRKEFVQIMNRSIQPRAGSEGEID